MSAIVPVPVYLRLDYSWIRCFDYIRDFLNSAAVAYHISAVCINSKRSFVPLVGAHLKSQIRVMDACGATVAFLASRSNFWEHSQGGLAVAGCRVPVSSSHTQFGARASEGLGSPLEVGRTARRDSRVHTRNLRFAPRMHSVPLTSTSADSPWGL